MYKWIIENREIFKIFYGILITLICTVIAVQADRLFRLSLHQGIRYFRNSFLFFALAFITRFFFGLESLGGIFPYPIIKFVFEFFIIMAGFFLLYSLLWRKIETEGKNYFSSLFNPIIILFYLVTLSIVILDYFSNTYFLMFLSQIIVFSTALIISITNQFKNEKRSKFLKFYSLAMLLSLGGWILNALVAKYLEWNHIFLINIYAINIIIFLLILCGVIKAMR